MKLRILFLTIAMTAFAISGSADAQFIGFILRANSGGGAAVVPPGPCSNSLDFSDACNSQYLGIPL